MRAAGDRPRARRSATALLAVLTALLPAVLVGAEPRAAGPIGPRPGSRDAADPYLPGYGNGGYDVGRYRLDIRYDPGTDRLDGTADLDATATQELSSFNLDFAGLDVNDVAVDGTAAGWHRDGDRELVVTPGEPLANGHRFTVEVRYTGRPGSAKGPFFDTADGAVVLGEPDAAARWYPVNDHPRDKAGYDIAITVPDGLTAIANGVPRGSQARDGWRTWRWTEDAPMASYLTMIAIGRFRVFESSHDGLPVFSAVDAALPAEVADATLARTPEIVDFLATRFGPYPFDALGGVVLADPRLSFALETQTRPVYARKFFEGGDANARTSVLAHELAHQWYGDSVSLRRWRDIWLNEGFATYAQWLWEEHLGGRSAQQAFDELYRAPPGDRIWRPAPGDPGADHLFAASVYVRGAMTLHALRTTVGDEAFFRVLREWAASRRHGNGSTGEFRALAERISGRRLDRLFNDWLYSTAKPSRPHR